MSYHNADYELKRPMEKEDVRKFEMSYVGVSGRLGTSVTVADWSTQHTGIITIASEALASNVATVVVTATGVGFALLKIAATFADGQKIHRTICVEVKEGRC